MVENIKLCGDEGANFPAHHFIIKPPDGNVMSPGECKNCGAVKIHKNVLDDGVSQNMDRRGDAPALPPDQALRDVSSFIPKNVDLLG